MAKIRSLLKIMQNNSLFIFLHEFLINILSFHYLDAMLTFIGETT